MGRPTVEGSCGRRGEAPKAEPMLPADSSGAAYPAPLRRASRMVPSCFRKKGRGGEKWPLSFPHGSLHSLGDEGAAFFCSSPGAADWRPGMAQRDSSAPWPLQKYMVMWGIQSETQRSRWQKQGERCCPATRRTVGVSVGRVVVVIESKIDQEVVAGATASSCRA